MSNMLSFLKLSIADIKFKAIGESNSGIDNDCGILEYDWDSSVNNTFDSLQEIIDHDHGEYENNEKQDYGDDNGECHT